MTNEQKELVKGTVPVLREHGVALTTYFYNRMLSHNPELKNVFNSEHLHTGIQPTALAMSRYGFYPAFPSACIHPRAAFRSKGICNAKAWKPYA